MNLRAATSASPDGLRAALGHAVHRAWEIREAMLSPETKGVENPTRSGIRTVLMHAVEQIGDDNFQKPDVLAMLGDELNPLSDWPLFALRDALDYCHEAALCGGDGGGPGLRKTGIGSLADGLDRLHKAISAELTVTNGHPAIAWTTAVQREIELRLASRNVTGSWSATVVADHTVIVWPTSNTLEALVVREPVWFECTIVDNTIVHKADADRFRVERALEIGIELIELNAKVAELMERQRGVLLPYMG